MTGEDRSRMAGLVRAVMAGSARVVASVGLLLTAGGLVIGALLSMALVAGDIDYEEGSLDPTLPLGAIGLAVVCLVASIIPALEDPPSRRAWSVLLVLALTSLAGCIALLASEIASIGEFLVLGTIGAMSAMACLWWLGTGLRPRPSLPPPA